jgi:hypothetical protein
VLENPSDDDGIAEKGDHRHAAPALGTEERIEEEDPVEQLGPAQGSAVDGRGCGLRGIGLGISSRGRRFDSIGERARRWRGQAGAQLRTVGENSVVSHHVQAGRGYESGEPTQEVERLQNQMGDSS